MDRYTKIVLTAIVVLLGFLVLDRGQEPKAIAEKGMDSESPYKDVEIVPASRTGGFYMIDRRSGNVWHYETMSQKGFPIRRTGTPGRIEKPGDQVKDLPSDDISVGK